MSEFFFQCPFCQQEIKADAEWIGKAAECPHCKTMIKVPNSSIRINSTPEKVFNKNNPIVSKSNKTNNTPTATRSIQCELCKKNISPYVAQCPHCGQMPKLIRYMKWVYLAGLFFVFLGYLANPFFYIVGGACCAVYIIASFTNHWMRF